MKKNGKACVIGVDIGGTKILTGLLDRRFKLKALEKKSVNAHKGEKAFLTDITDSIEAVLRESGSSRKHILAIGLGCPAMVDAKNGVVKLAPNISFLKNYPLREKLSKYFRVPIFIENDVNAGLYGEHAFGAARGLDNVVGLFIGTGVGGALILDGKLYHGATGCAGEIGHIFMSPPSAFHTGRPGENTLEGLIGRFSIASEASFLVLRQKARRLFDLAGCEPKKMKSNTLAAAIRSGDKSVKNLITAKARILGLAMANIVNILNPEVIILGGGIIEAMQDLIVPVARDAMQEYAMPPVVKSVKVFAAKLGDLAVLKGSAKLAYDLFTAKKAD